MKPPETDLQWNFPYRSQRMPVMAKNIVATSQPLAAQAGLRMLVAGGNAVDAALATAIALTVTEPVSNGLGSDAFALIWDGTMLHGFNGSGRSPAAWRFEDYAAMAEMPQFGWGAVTVPGAVDAWARIHHHFGALPFGALFEPAIRYARDGFLVSPIIAASWAEAVRDYIRFSEFARTFLPDGRAPRPGERFANPDQAETLARIAETGGEAFYRGDIAGKIVKCAEKEGGRMAFSDMADHRGDWVEPLSVSYRGVTVHEIPPNGQGMAALIALGVLDRLFLDAHDRIDTTDGVHLQIEAMKVGFSAAHAHIADPDHMKVPFERFLADDFLSEMAGRIRAKYMGAASEPGPSPAVDHGTVYLTAADADGMMVSMIQSNYTGFGSGVVIPGTGISMHNRGCGFRIDPGHPNCVGGGKRPYHTIIPGFVARNGQPLMSFGVMGAHMQPQGHVQMVTRVVGAGQNPQAASDAPRWHLCEDGTVAFEKGFPADVIVELARRGHRILRGEPRWGYGGAQLIYCLDDGYCAASDHRKDGQAVGW